MNDYSTDLFVSLTDWRRLKAASFQMSALYIYDLKNSKSTENTATSTEEDDTIKAVAFAGSYRGEIVRFHLYKSKSISASCSFAHAAKVVDFASCKIPVIIDVVASLSTDGTICLWNVTDGICINKFENLLPNGCQHIAISPKAVELGVVSGAFPSVYVIDILQGIITQQIRPCNSFVSGIGFYSTVKSSWLFTIDCTGIATYTTLTPSTAKSHKIRLFSPKDFILFAKPNTDFTYLLAASAYRFYIISLTQSDFASYTLDTECPIAQIEWIDCYTATVLQMDGHFTTYKVCKPKFENKGEYHTTVSVTSVHPNLQSNEETHMIHARVISKLINLSSAPINSSIQTAGNYQSVHQISRNTVSNLDPFSTDIRPPQTSPPAKPHYYTMAPQHSPPISSNDKAKIPVPPAPSQFTPPTDDMNDKEKKKKHHHHKDKNKDADTETTTEDLENPENKHHHKKFNFFKRFSHKLKNDKKHKTLLSMHHHHHHKHKHDKNSPTLSTFDTSNATTTTVFSNTYNTEDQLEEDVYSDSSEYDRNSHGEEEDYSSEIPKMVLDGKAQIRSPCLSSFDGGIVIGFDDTISIEKHDFGECSISPKHRENDDDNKRKNEETDSDTDNDSNKNKNKDDDDEESKNEETDSETDNDSHKNKSKGDDNNNDNKIDQNQASYLTAQCFIWTKKPNNRSIHDKSDSNKKNVVNDIDEEPEFYYEIAAIVEGYNNGEVHISYLNQVKDEVILSKKHDNKVVALFATQKFIFTSGEDCLVHIYQIRDDNEIFKYHKTLYQFTSPVIGFYRTERETSTDVDHSLFCVTRGSIVSMLDLKSLENKRIMSGHDSQIKSIYFHPASMMLLIHCNSLYFWSLSSSQLESIVTDHKKFMYLQNIKNSITKNDGQFVRIVPVMKYRSGILLQPLKIGSVVFQVPLINLETFTSITRSVVKENMNSPMKELLTQIPNFHFIYSLFTSIGINKESGDQKFSNINKDIQFSIGLVGDKKVVTLASAQCQLTHETVFNTSSLVTSAILAAHALFSVAFSGYKYSPHVAFRSLLKKELNQSDSTLFFLLQYMFGCSIDVHDLVFKTVSEFPVETKKNWIQRLTESKIQFPNYHRAFCLIKCTLAETMLDSIPAEEGKADVNDLADVLFSDLNAAPYARRIAVNNIDYFTNNVTAENVNRCNNNNNKGFFYNLLIKIAENAPNSEADLNSLLFLYTQKPNQCLQIATTSIEDGHQKAAIGFIRGFCNYIIDFENKYKSNDSNETDLYHGSIRCMLYLFIKSGLDESAYVYRKLAKKNNRITYSSKLNAIAYASIIGFLYIELKYQSVSIGDNCNLNNHDINSIKFDKNNQIQVSYLSSSKKVEQAIIKTNIEKGVIEQTETTGNALSFDDQKQGWVQISQKEKVRVRLS